MKLQLPMVKDLGLKKRVMDALPYAVVGETWRGTFTATADDRVVLNHIVPTGVQLKILFLRIFTQESDGATFYIYQSNPAAAGATGAVEAYPVIGEVPSGYRDYPMLEAAGSEVLRGNLREPVQVCEGSINFGILATPTPATGSYYGITWWGVQKTPDETPGQ